MQIRKPISVYLSEEERKQAEKLAKGLGAKSFSDGFRRILRLFAAMRDS